MRKFLALSVLATSLLLGGCTRIETGEVGLRVNASLEIQGTELQPGSWNQTLIGSVLEFPVRDIAGSLENKNPLTKETVALEDFDLSYAYSVNSAAVSDLWSKYPRVQHDTASKEGVLLMKRYMDQVLNSASYKAVSGYTALEIGSAREKVEVDIRKLVAEKLKEDKLDTTLTLTVLQVRAIVPPKSILESAAAVVRSQNELKIKQNEVEIARKEAERMQALSSNSGSSIAYMDAQARLNYSEAAKLGKVNTIIVPSDFKGMLSVPK